MFLPSEIARLVLGYLKESQCVNTYESFLAESKHLEEYFQGLESNCEYPTNVGGESLVGVLQKYCRFKNSSGNNDSDGNVRLNSSNGQRSFGSATENTDHFVQDPNHGMQVLDNSRLKNIRFRRQKLHKTLFASCTVNNSPLQLTASDNDVISSFTQTSGVIDTACDPVYESTPVSSTLMMNRYIQVPTPVHNNNNEQDMPEPFSCSPSSEISEQLNRNNNYHVQSPLVNSDTRLHPSAMILETPRIESISANCAILRPQSEVMLPTSTQLNCQSNNYHVQSPLVNPDTRLHPPATILETPRSQSAMTNCALIRPRSAQSEITLPTSSVMQTSVNDFTSIATDSYATTSMQNDYVAPITYPPIISITEANNAMLHDHNPSQLYSDVCTSRASSADSISASPVRTPQQCAPPTIPLRHPYYLLHSPKTFETIFNRIPVDSFTTPSKSSVRHDSPRRKKNFTPRRRLLPTTPQGKNKITDEVTATIAMVATTMSEPPEVHNEDSLSEFAVWFEQLLSSQPLHEKIAENINKAVMRDVPQEAYIQPPPCPASLPTTETIATTQSHSEITISNNVIQDIINRTQSDPVFESILSVFGSDKVDTPTKNSTAESSLIDLCRADHIVTTAVNVSSVNTKEITPVASQVTTIETETSFSYPNVEKDGTQTQLIVSANGLPNITETPLVNEPIDETCIVEPRLDLYAANMQVTNSVPLDGCVVTTSDGQGVDGQPQNVRLTPVKLVIAESMKASVRNGNGSCASGNVTTDNSLPSFSSLFSNPVSGPSNDNRRTCSTTGPNFIMVNSSTISSSSSQNIGSSNRRFNQVGRSRRTMQNELISSRVPMKNPEGTSVGAPECNSSVDASSALPTSSKHRSSFTRDLKKLVISADREHRKLNKKKSGSHVRSLSFSSSLPSACNVAGLHSVLHEVETPAPKSDPTVPPRKNYKAEILKMKKRANGVSDDGAIKSTICLDDAESLGLSVDVLKDSGQRTADAHVLSEIQLPKRSKRNSKKVKASDNRSTELSGREEMSNQAPTSKSSQRSVKASGRKSSKQKKVHFALNERSSSDLGSKSKVPSTEARSRDVDVRAPIESEMTVADDRCKEQRLQSESVMPVCSVDGASSCSNRKRDPDISATDEITPRPERDRSLAESSAKEDTNMAPTSRNSSSTEVAKPPSAVETVPSERIVDVEESVRPEASTVAFQTSRDVQEDIVAKTSNRTKSKSSRHRQNHKKRKKSAKSPPRNDPKEKTSGRRDIPCGGKDVPGVEEKSANGQWRVKKKKNILKVKFGPKKKSGPIGANDESTDTRNDSSASQSLRSDSQPTKRRQISPELPDSYDELSAIINEVEDYRFGNASKRRKSGADIAEPRLMCEERIEDDTVAESEVRFGVPSANDVTMWRRVIDGNFFERISNHERTLQRCDSDADCIDAMDLTTNSGDATSPNNDDVTLPVNMTPKRTVANFSSVVPLNLSLHDGAFPSCDDRGDSNAASGKRCSDAALNLSIRCSAESQNSDVGAKSSSPYNRGVRTISFDCAKKNHRTDDLRLKSARTEELTRRFGSSSDFVSQRKNPYVKLSRLKIPSRATTVRCSANGRIRMLPSKNIGYRSATSNARMFPGKSIRLVDYSCHLSSEEDASSSSDDESSTDNVLNGSGERPISENLSSSEKQHDDSCDGWESFRPMATAQEVAAVDLDLTSDEESPRKKEQRSQRCDDDAVTGGRENDVIENQVAGVTIRILDDGCYTRQDVQTLTDDEKNTSVNSELPVADPAVFKEPVMPMKKRKMHFLTQDHAMNQQNLNTVVASRLNRLTDLDAFLDKIHK